MLKKVEKKNYINFCLYTLWLSKRIHYSDKFLFQNFTFYMADHNWKNANLRVGTRKVLLLVKVLHVFMVGKWNLKKKTPKSFGEKIIFTKIQFHFRYGTDNFVGHLIKEHSIESSFWSRYMEALIIVNAS